MPVHTNNIGCLEYFNLDSRRVALGKLLFNVISPAGEKERRADSARTLDRARYHDRGPTVATHGVECDAHFRYAFSSFLGDLAHEQAGTETQACELGRTGLVGSICSSHA